MALTHDGTRVLASCLDGTLQILDVPTLKEQAAVKCAHRIATLSVSSDDAFVLLQLSQGDIELRNLLSLELVHAFPLGATGEYLLGICFGGPGDAFAIVGDTDGCVTLYHRGSTTLLTALQGHAGTVNAVAWRPQCAAGMLASASDDRTICLWGASSV